MLNLAKGMGPQELEFNFTKQELYSMAQELNIKGRSKMDKIVLALNIEEALNNIAAEIQEQETAAEEVAAADPMQLLAEIKEELISAPEGEGEEILNEAIDTVLSLIAEFEKKTGYKIGGI